MESDGTVRLFSGETVRLRHSRTTRNSSKYANRRETAAISCLDRAPGRSSNHRQCGAIKDKLSTRSMVSNQHVFIGGIAGGHDECADEGEKNRREILQFTFTSLRRVERCCTSLTCQRTLLLAIVDLMVAHGYSSTNVKHGKVFSDRYSGHLSECLPSPQWH